MAPLLFDNHDALGFHWDARFNEADRVHVEVIHMYNMYISKCMAMK